MHLTTLNNIKKRSSVKAAKQKPELLYAVRQAQVKKKRLIIPLRSSDHKLRFFRLIKVRKS